MSDAKAGAAPWWRADIQGLRALAVLLVVGFHAGGFLDGGFIGVDVFFVVSGHVIAGLLLRELEVGSSVDLVRFYGRRIRRLWPALALTLVVVSAVTTFLGPMGTVTRTRETAQAAALLVANGHLYRYAGDGYFAVNADRYPLLHMWSLSIEEQFYLLIPVVLLVAWRLGRRRASVTALGIITLGSLAASAAFLLDVVPGAIPRPDSFAYYAPFTRAWEFGAGMLVALVGRTSTSRVAPIAGLVAVIGAAVMLDGSVTVPGVAVAIPVIGTAMLLITSGGPVGALLAWGPLTWLGDRSYSWYLWHWPFIVWGRALWPGQGAVVDLAMALAALVPAIATYRFVENRFRTPRSNWQATARVALPCVAGPFLVASLLHPVDHWIDRTKAGAAFDLAVAPHLDTALGCDSATVPSARPASCTIGPAAESTGRIVLVGDSSAGHLSEAVAGAAEMIGSPAVLSTRSGCPFIDVRVGGSKPRCRDHVRATVADLVAHPPKAVVLATSTAGVLECGGCPLLIDGSPAPVTDRGQKVKLFEQGLRSVLSELSRAGVPVLLVHSSPAFGPWVLRDCAALRLLADPKSCATSRSHEYLRSVYGEIVRIESSAAAGLDSVSTVPVRDIVCGGSGCSTYRGRSWVYRDGTHLTPTASSDLAPTVAEALRRLLASHLPR